MKFKSSRSCHKNKYIPPISVSAAELNGAAKGGIITLTFQDLEKVPDRDQERIDFVAKAISTFKGSDLYKGAVIADEYMRGQNREAKRHKNVLTTSTGQLKEDQWSPNNKTTRSFLRLLIWGDVQYLLGNGIKWDNKNNIDARFGRAFDNRIRELLISAKAAGVAFGYFNHDHIEVFPVKTDSGGFVPLYDEENGALRAGIKWWERQVPGAKNVTKRAILYEVSGITNFLWDDDNASGVILPQTRGNEILKKVAYTVDKTGTAVDGYTIYDGANYPSFPIIPMWGNTLRKGELFLGIKELIDAYDRIANGYLNDIDTALLYWIIENAGGADNEEIAQFIDQMKALHAANADGARITPVTIDIPVNAREGMLNRLETAIYDDYMGLNFKNIVNGAATATQIRAAYEPVKTKANDTEQCVLDFLYALMDLTEVNDNPTFEPDAIINLTEETNAVIAGANYLPAEYITEELLYLRGDGDKVEEILQQMDAENMQRMSGLGLEEPQEETSESEGQTE